MCCVKSLHALTISTSEQAAVGQNIHKRLSQNPELSRVLPSWLLLSSLLGLSVPIQNVCLHPVDRWVETVADFCPINLALTMHQ